MEEFAIQRTEEITVSGQAAKAAAERLRNHYLWREHARQEIDDVEYADGPVHNIANAVRAVREKAGDPYTAVLYSDNIDDDHRSARNWETKRKQEQTIWSTLLRTREDIVGYLNYPAFYPTSANKFAKRLKKLPRKSKNQRNIGTLVVDLRGNRGGKVSEANKILGMLAPGTTYRLQTDPNQILCETEVVECNGRMLHNHANITVLVDETSASASNILAGTLQDYGLATVVGQKTNPKATQQSFTNIQQGPDVQLKYTSAKILMCSGYDILANEGLDPDISYADIADGRLTRVDPFNSVMFQEPIALGRDIASRNIAYK